MKSIEIFSGAGGLARGLENAGFIHQAFVEFNKHACNSLIANYDNDKVFFGDVRDYDFSQYSDIDIVAGGPPCQPFSLGGKHLGHEDERDMFPFAIKAIESLNPKAFIFENVKGLLRPTFSDYFKYILLRLTFPKLTISGNISWREHLEQLKRVDFDGYDDLKYRISYELINAADFGVPQCRERVFIAGIRSDIKKPWKFPEPTHSEDRLLWDKYISGKYWMKFNMSTEHCTSYDSNTKEKIDYLYKNYGFLEPTLLPWRTVRDALIDVPDPRTDHCISDHIFHDGARIYPGHTGSDLDWPSKTIKAGGHGVPGGENMIRFNDNTVRYFTVYEAKRVQTFPDNYMIYGSWGEAMRQIGNAVPVQLAEIMGKALFQLLK